MRVTKRMTAAEGAAVMRASYRGRALAVAQRRAQKATGRRASMWAAIAEELTESKWETVAPGCQWTHPDGGVIYETSTGFEWHANGKDGWNTPTLAQAKQEAEEAS